MVEARFDELIHAPVRLRICGLLRQVDQLDFAVVRDALALSDANLSKHLRHLVDAGYVTSVKGASHTRSDRRRLTWLSLTPTGRAAFEAHAAALVLIVEQASGDAEVP